MCCRLAFEWTENISVSPRAVTPSRSSCKESCVLKLAVKRKIKEELLGIFVKWQIKQLFRLPIFRWFRKMLSRQWDVMVLAEFCCSPPPLTAFTFPQVLSLTKPCLFPACHLHSTTGNKHLDTHASVSSTRSASKHQAKFSIPCIFLCPWRKGG